MCVLEFERQRRPEPLQQNSRPARTHTAGIYGKAMADSCSGNRNNKGGEKREEKKNVRARDKERERERDR